MSIFWLIALFAYGAVAALVARHVAHRMVDADKDQPPLPDDRAFFAFTALLLALIWPLTLAFFAFQLWVLPKEADR